MLSPTDTVSNNIVVNGGAPGISAAFLNAMETQLFAMNSASVDANITSNGAGLMALLGLNVNPTAVTVAGSTSGTMTLYQPLRGTVKMVLVIFVNFRNSGGATQNAVLPTAFTGRSKYVIGASPSVRPQALLSSVAQNIVVYTALPGTGGTDGGGTIFTGFPGQGWGEILAAWDTFSVPSGGASAVDGVFFAVGT